MIVVPAVTPLPVMVLPIVRMPEVNVVTVRVVAVIEPVTTVAGDAALIV